LTPRPALVTAADAGYFELLQGLVGSVRDRQKRDVALHCLDIGLEQEQAAWARANMDHVVRPDWPTPELGRRGLHAAVMGQIARPFLPDYFPGASHYIWIDSDAWIQDWESIELFLAAADAADIAIVTESHPRYDASRGKAMEYLRARRHYYVTYYGVDAAERFQLRPVFNCGVFAMRDGSPYWRHYRRELLHCAEAADLKYVDQISLNRAIWLTGGETVLPTRHNWLCNNARPLLDAENGRLIEHYFPHEPIGIVHLAGPNKSAQYRATRLRQRNGTEQTVDLFYDEFKAWGASRSIAGA
jgi:lipopolysaccharide biosynthesis glycosyltransferase